MNPMILILRVEIGPQCPSPMSLLVKHKVAAGLYKSDVGVSKWSRPCFAFKDEIM